RKSRTTWRVRWAGTNRLTRCKSLRRSPPCGQVSKRHALWCVSASAEIQTSTSVLPGIDPALQHVNVVATLAENVSAGRTASSGVAANDVFLFRIQRV